MGGIVKENTDAEKDKCAPNDAKCPPRTYSEKRRKGDKHSQTRADIGKTQRERKRGRQKKSEEKTLSFTFTH